MRKINWEKEYESRPHWSGKLLRIPIEIEKLFSITKKHNIKGKVLDIGCGTGEKTYLISKKFKVIGVDVSKNALKIARQKHKNIKFVLGSAEKLKFKNKSFEIVFSKDVLNFTNIEKSAKELFRILKPRGLACLSFMAQTISKNKKTRDITKKIIEVYKKLKFDFLKKEILYVIDKKPKWHKHKKLILLLRKNN